MKSPELDLIIGAAKKDPRYKKAKGEADAPEMDDTDDEAAEGDGLDEVFSAKQAAAVRAYVDSCMKSGDGS
jgi:hypothetical protein